MNDNFNIPKSEAISLASQIALAHGLTALKVSFFNTPKDKSLLDAPDIILPGQNSNYLLSHLVYDTVTFMGNNLDGSLSYYDFNTQRVVTVPKLQLPIALCRVVKNTHVVKSNIAGRNGTIKQYINTGDYEIEIRGVFTTGISDKFPLSAMQHLQRITNSTTEVKVASNFLQIFGINYLVFESSQFEQAEDKGRDVQMFTLNCISEIPFALKVLTEGTTTSNPFGNTVV